MNQLPAWLLERGCVYEPKRKQEDFHDDDRRTLFTLTNGEFEFSLVQVKIAVMKGARVLGGHYHLYRELFTMATGEAVFRLVNPNDREDYVDLPIPTMGRLLVPVGVPHAAIVSDGGVLIGGTEERYVSPQHNDVPFGIEPPTLSP